MNPSAAVRRLHLQVRHLSATAMARKSPSPLSSPLSAFQLTIVSQSTTHVSSVLRTPLVRTITRLLQIGSAFICVLTLGRTPSLHRARRCCRVSFPRHPPLCRPKQWHPQHDRRGPPLDQREDGDLKRGAVQPHQAGHQEGPSPLCPQLLPPPWLHLELWCFPPSTCCWWLELVDCDLIPTRPLDLGGP